MIKRVAFDYGRTLFDRENNSFFPEVHSVLSELSKKFKLSIVSYAKPDDVEVRIRAMKSHGIWDLFDGVWFVDEPELKHSALDELLMKYNLAPCEVAVVDDYVLRGISWANARGAVSIWFRNGKFAAILPDEIVGPPSFEISNFGELPKCLLT